MRPAEEVLQPSRGLATATDGADAAPGPQAHGQPQARSADSALAAAAAPPQLQGLCRSRDDVMRGLADLASCFLPRDLRKKVGPLQEQAHTISADLDRALQLHGELLARNRCACVCCWDAGVKS